MPNGHKRWCFTLNHPTEDEKAALPTTAASLQTGWPFCTHLVYQLEQGEAGTEHFQGYCRFEKQRSLGIVKTLLLRAHWEPAKGTTLQNYEYCTKQLGRLADPVIIGVFAGVDGLGPRHLRRSELLTLLQEDPYIHTDEIIAKGGLDILCTSPTLIGTARGFLLRNRRRDGVTCDLYYGSTGTGKSRLSDTLYPDSYRKAPGPWWDMYAGEQVVVYDDFDDAFMPIGNLLRAIDRYPVYTEYKGGYVALSATHFVITSNLLPREWYPHASVLRLNAIYRRINRVFEFKQDGYYIEHNGWRYLHDEVRTEGIETPLPWTLPQDPDLPTSPTSSIQDHALTPTQPISPLEWDMSSAGSSLSQYD